MVEQISADSLVDEEGETFYLVRVRLAVTRQPAHLQPLRAALRIGLGHLPEHAREQAQDRRGRQAGADAVGQRFSTT